MDLLFNEIFFTLIALGVSLLIRQMLLVTIRGKRTVVTKDQRRWMNRVKAFGWCLFILGLVIIWAPYLRSFAISILALAVALSIALKELIHGVIGSFFRVSTHPFKVGDWIDIDGTTGEVMDISLFQIRLEEIDIAGKTYNYTGKTVFIPTHHLISHTYKNLNFLKRFVWYDIRFHLKGNAAQINQDIQKIMQLAQDATQPYAKEAEALLQKVRHKAAIDIADHEPIMFYGHQGPDYLTARLRIFVPPQEALNIQNHIVSHCSGIESSGV